MTPEALSTFSTFPLRSSYIKDIGGKETNPDHSQPFFTLMRKIEAQMNAAIKADKNWSSGNTQVVTNCGVSTVYLHGNKIALVDDTSVTVFDGGWQSVTTKSRLNAIINEFCNALTDGVFQKDYKWFVRDNNEVKDFHSGYVFA